jgi:hypothetical protein
MVVQVPHIQSSVRLVVVVQVRWVLTQFQELLAVLAVLALTLAHLFLAVFLRLVAAAVAVQLVVLAVHQLVVLAVQMRLVRPPQQILAVAVAVAAIQELLLVVLAVAELFTSGLRFKYERTIFCTN